MRRHSGFGTLQSFLGIPPITHVAPPALRSSTLALALTANKEPAWGAPGGSIGVAINGRLRIHDLRHTLGRPLRKDLGVPLETIMGILRHADIRETLICAPYSLDEGRAAMGKLDEAAPAPVPAPPCPSASAPAVLG